MTFNLAQDYGMIITAAAALLFYLRLAMLRGKHRRLAREQSLEQMRTAAQRKKPKSKLKEPPLSKPSIQVSSWVVVGIAIILMLAGVIAKNSLNIDLPEVVREYWWVGPSLGFILFTAGFK
jgi:hypothetical protein